MGMRARSQACLHRGAPKDGEVCGKRDQRCLARARSTSRVPPANTSSEWSGFLGYVAQPMNKCGETNTVLRAIQKAQDAGLCRPGRDGTPRCVNPPFSIACKEIRQGSKRSHWIWYVWPSLRAVRTSMHPEFLLPDFSTACMYLQNPTLTQRLLEVSELAIRHLEHGVDPAVLFGKMHHCDFPKFYETMSLFAIAAHVNGDADQEAVFLAGVLACAADRLDENTVKAVLREGLPGITLAVQHVSAALHDLALA